MIAWFVLLTLIPWIVIYLVDSVILSSNNWAPGSSVACEQTVLNCRSFCSQATDDPGARFSKAPETFRALKAIFSSSVSKNGEVYTPETSCMKGY